MEDEVLEKLVVVLGEDHEPGSLDDVADVIDEFATVGRELLDLKDAKEGEKVSTSRFKQKGRTERTSTGDAFSAYKRALSICLLEGSLPSRKAWKI